MLGHQLTAGEKRHSSVLAWRIPGTEEPGGLLSMGSHRVGHDWSNVAAAAAEDWMAACHLPFWTPSGFCLVTGAACCSHVSLICTGGKWFASLRKGSSLAVQWLRFSAFIAGGVGFIRSKDWDPTGCKLWRHPLPQTEETLNKEGTIT